MRDSKQPEKYMGSSEEWGLAQGALAKALERKGTPYNEALGEAVFYGPKIDVKIVDSWRGRGSVQRSSSTSTCRSVSM